MAKGLSAIAVKRKTLETYAIWGRQRSIFTLTDFQCEWRRLQERSQGQDTNRGARSKIRKDNYPRMATHYENNLKSSIRASSRALDIPSTSLWRILRRDLKFVPFKVNKLIKDCIKKKEITKCEKHFACDFYLRIETFTRGFSGVTKNGGFWTQSRTDKTMKFGRVSTLAISKKSNIRAKAKSKIDIRAKVKCAGLAFFKAKSWALSGSEMRMEDQ